MTAPSPRILVVDVGGSNVKLFATGRRRILKLPSGPTLTPPAMVAAVRAATADWAYDVISVGCPAPVAGGRPVAEPHNLGAGWLGFDFGAAFGRPVQLLNDAAMQALGGYRGGRMLFLGFGTGLGSALVVEGHVQPLELAHLPYRNGQTFEAYVGGAARKRMGTRRWRHFVLDVVGRLVVAMQTDSLLLGGGNARRLQKCLDRLPPGTRLGSNVDAIRGGFCLWQAPEARAALRVEGRQGDGG